MKLRLDEYYSIINEEWEDIESYMPEDMEEEFEKFRESHTQMEIIQKCTITEVPSQRVISC